MKYALIILLNQDKSRVLMQLKDRSIYAEKYNFPGGKIRTGKESIAEGALRELQEETGVMPWHVKNLKWLGTLMLPHDCRVGHENEIADLTFYAAKIDESLPCQQPGETEPLEWKSIDSLDEMQKANTLAGGGELQYFLAEALRAL